MIIDLKNGRIERYPRKGVERVYLVPYEGCPIGGGCWSLDGRFDD